MTEVLQTLLEIRIPLIFIGTPVVEAGVSGMTGYTGILVPSYSFPGMLSVEWLADFQHEELGKGRMTTAVTHGTVIDLTSRIGYLLALDYAEEMLGIREVLQDDPSSGSVGRVLDYWSISEMRKTYWWMNFPRRVAVIRALVRGIKERQLVIADRERRK